MRLKSKEKFFYVNAAQLLGNHDREVAIDYSKKSILVICSGFSGNANCLKITSEMNYGYTVNLTSTKCWSEEFFDDTIIANDRDLSRKDETLNAVKAFMKERSVKFDAVITVHEYCVQMTSYLASELGCLGIPLEVARTMQDKYEFRKHCDQLGITTPKYNLIKSDARQTHIDTIGFFHKASSSSDDQIMCLKLSSQLVRILANTEPPFIIKDPSGAAKGK
jgi:hypothetical protein